MTRPGLPLLLLCLLGALAFFMRDPADLIDPARHDQQREQVLPQTYAEQTRSLTFDEHGVLADIMEAASVRHFEQRDESLLEEPRFYSHNRDDKTWSATARRGTLRPGKEVLTLEQDVVLTNDASGGELKTQAMTIRLAEKIAYSDVPVEITEGRNRISADGMRANLERERVEMGPNVESVYVPPE